MIEEGLRQTLRQRLMEDAPRHGDMIDLLDRGIAEIVKADETGICMKSTQTKLFALTTQNEAFAADCLRQFGGEGTLVCHQLFYAEEAEKLFKAPPFRLEFLQGVYLGGVAPLSPCEAELRLMDESHLPFMAEHYHAGIEKEYLAERLRNGHVLGAFVDGRPAGFIGIHDEGAVGMLEIAPEYRRRGIARALETEIINRQVRRGLIPYMQIRTDNQASLALQRLLGVTLAATPTAWLFGE